MPFTDTLGDISLNTCHKEVLHVVIVGAGLGGLSCAIACRKCDPPLQVTILERTAEFKPIGAGIQLPPNATRIMEDFGLLTKLKDFGAVVMENHTLRRYSTGETIVSKPLGLMAKQRYGAEWLADYQRILLEEALRLGAKIRNGAEVVAADSEYERKHGKACVILKDESQVYGDVVVGADGLWSVLRNHVLGRPSLPIETGDLAYRGTFTRSQLQELKDDRVTELLSDSNIQVWLGPEAHVVFYPVRNKDEFNLVLLCPDNLPHDVRTLDGNLEEMREEFKDWDPLQVLEVYCFGGSANRDIIGFGF
ncbi:hypothetical protein TARUN_1524 [Trichoderma arundinaceum]|uniref:FAD-binding domain-containing protein n=1 Tax=Trichoderma arundinaceum TaxID=490622 RepID=A0A395NX66_TRIAR|nr:hypothetical protein TARUN_1524 [Trichoderma arundinaceum]